jgi:molybdenum cofactor synthesis domain-containing protein
VSEVIVRRACVISTGAEVVEGKVRDTNRVLLESRLTQAGYNVEFRGPVADELWSLVAALTRAAEDGFGLIVTTGGVGAEAKDLTVEAVLEADPEAHTPYICLFEGQSRRHVKPGVRIAVARINGSLVIALPGPTDEVAAGLDVALPLLAGGDRADAVLAESIARRLREQWRSARKHDYRKADDDVQVPE